jgi:hypothetical protein
MHAEQEAMDGTHFSIAAPLVRFGPSQSAAKSLQRRDR